MAQTRSILETTASHYPKVSAWQHALQVVQRTTQPLSPTNLHQPKDATAQQSLQARIWQLKMIFAPSTGKRSAPPARVSYREILPDSNPQILLTEYDQPHHKTFASFCAAVEKGCYICTRFREHGLITAFDEQVASRERELAAQNPFTIYRVVLLPDDPQPVAAVDIGWGGLINNMMRFISYRSQGKYSLQVILCPSKGR